MRVETSDSAKRALDLIVASAALVISAPLQLVIAAIIRLKLGSPVLFRQERPGLNGRLFTLFKFRTMLPPDPSLGIVDDADRLTALGSFLRETSLDELPTLWNVLRGDMSLVGPRPLLPEYLPLYSPRQSTRHDVRPGMTGMAQVSGRNELSWDAKLELDAQYVETRSLLLDARIIARTFGAVLQRRGIAREGHATTPKFDGSRDPDMDDRL